MSKTDLTKVEEKINKTDLTIVKVEENSVIVVIDGWRMRVYGNTKGLRLGQLISVEYTGDIENVHSVKLLPLK